MRSDGLLTYKGRNAQENVVNIKYLTECETVHLPEVGAPNTAYTIGYPRGLWPIPLLRRNGVVHPGVKIAQAIVFNWKPGRSSAVHSVGFTPSSAAYSSRTIRSTGNGNPQLSSIHLQNNPLDRQWKPPAQQHTPPEQSARQAMETPSSAAYTSRTIR
ncbi:hypothetical protein RRG08_032047 [Elysia crispata]|uniref:Uncharacterized protein n=1 Tax=Elysia crispata TaxID=231223 RepID=A0AAE0XVS7_9GAST|nr:hypothetical protein RRG08_032047 [Elysia crispata]